MGFHICIVGYVFGIPLSLFWEAPPKSFFFASTNPTLLHVKPVSAATSRASSSRLKLIITLAKRMSFRRGELAVKARDVEQGNPILEFSNSIATRRSPQGTGAKAGATNPQAPTPAYSDRLSQLEKDMAEIRDGTIKEVLEKLRHLSYEIEEINTRFDLLDRTGETLDDFRLKVNHYERKMTNL